MGFFGFHDITGIDIGAGSIKMVRYSGFPKPKIVAASLLELPLGPGEGSVAAGLSMLHGGRKLGGKIVTLLPGRNLTIRHATFPKMPLSELREAVRWESKRHISYPLESAMIEYLLLGERLEGTTTKYDVLLVATELATVREHLSPFDQTGITVNAVDANPLALRNVFHLQDVKTDANVLVVDLGAGKTEINIFRQGALRFSRCIETGGFEMTQAVAEELGMGLDEAEALKRRTSLASVSDEDRAAPVIRTKLDGILLEIRRSVEYYKSTFRERSVERTILTGGVALTAGLQEYFTRDLEGPVELCEPFQGLISRQGVLDEFAGATTRFSAAMGLALRKA